MRTQAKRFWQIAILAALAVAPAACGDDEKDNDDQGPPPPPGDGDGNGDGDITGDGDGDVASDAGTDGAVDDPCPAPKSSLEFLNQCAKESIQRVKFDNATRLPSQTLPPL